ncbi:MAG: polysulfide reductase NrfD [Nitrospirae bacterium]|nr:polysulfide reductase NrfD [Nitrospirota bacterium]
MQDNRNKVSLFSIGSVILLILIAAGIYAAVNRFSTGLGASTNLSDEVPWGLWVAFDVLCGVALAAGGFTITAAVYIFNMKKYKPIARPAILTAFIGYLMVVLGLIVDIGQPMRFWHPLVMWQPRSVMFEVVMCISLYTTVLALEFAPAFLEKLGLNALVKILKFFTFPLVIAGIILSFLHQSSLGAFFLIMPAKLNSLWYSPYMPQFFYVSAIAVGLAMVSFEAIVGAWAFKRPQETELLKGLGKGTAITLFVYLVLKVADLSMRGALPLAFDGSMASRFYMAEIGLGVISPMILLAITGVRESLFGVLGSSVLVIGGVIMNRFNTNVNRVNKKAAADLSCGRFFPSYYKGDEEDNEGTRHDQQPKQVDGKGIGLIKRLYVRRLVLLPWRGSRRSGFFRGGRDVFRQRRPRRFQIIFRCSHFSDRGGLPPGFIINPERSSVIIMVMILSDVQVPDAAVLPARMSSAAVGLSGMSSSRERK